MSSILSLYNSESMVCEPAESRKRKLLSSPDSGSRKRELPISPDSPEKENVLYRPSPGASCSSKNSPLRKARRILEVEKPLHCPSQTTFFTTMETVGSLFFSNQPSSQPFACSSVFPAMSLQQPATLGHLSFDLRRNDPLSLAPCPTTACDLDLPPLESFDFAQVAHEPMRPSTPQEDEDAELSALLLRAGTPSEEDEDPRFSLGGLAKALLDLDSSQSESED